jgi:hypothetical protein
MKSPPGACQCSINATRRSAEIRPNHFKIERHVSGDALNWAHFFFMYSIWALGRASAECMNEEMRSLSALDAVSAINGAQGQEVSC